MPINQPPASATVSQIIPPEAQQASNRRASEHTHMQRVRAGFATIEATIGLSGLAVVLVGVVLAIGGSVLAIHEGVPYSLAVMVGYCTAVGSGCLGAALSNVRRRAPTVAAPISMNREPNYAAWKLVSKFRISDASRLWCDIEPGSPASQESIAWGNAMLDAVKRGELPAIAKTGTSQAANAQEQRNPGWSTEIGRDDLTAWAKAHGHSPRFLQK
ncbi:MAG: hypothetical protein K2Y71_14625 [Xanthobacteraceae bacterium]|nr:hypothetical protein [Xanthobacteraceae bacterium]